MRDNPSENLLRSRRQCATPMKRAYRTKALALMHAALADGPKKPKLYAYRCTSCRSWHLTRTAPR